MTTATKVRVTKIWKDTIEQRMCTDPRCRRVMYRAQNVRTGKFSPYDNRPIPLAVEQEIGTGREMWLIDLAQASSHFASCIGATSFRRPR